MNEFVDNPISPHKLDHLTSVCDHQDLVIVNEENSILDKWDT